MKKLLVCLLSFLLIFSNAVFLTACDSSDTDDGGGNDIVEEETGPYVIVDEDTIKFGKYPQSEVTDSATTSALLEKAGNPVDDVSDWKDYNYYVKGKLSSIMYYKDVEYNGQKYRGVYLINYRPEYSYDDISVYNTYQDDCGYEKGNVYWFKYEWISWTVLEKDEDNALILADIAIDAQSYQNTYEYKMGWDYNNGEGVPNYTYANNYEYSTIRKWLNDTFYQTAFDTLQQELIQTTEVDNSLSSTGDTSNRFVCKNTMDKVFLLSAKEVTSFFDSDSKRIKGSTDYANSQGCMGMGDNVSWWIRTPSTATGSYYAKSVSETGEVIYKIITINYLGIVPALTIKLS